VGTDWLKIEWDITAETENTSLVFDLGLVSADYYIDNVLVYDKTAEASEESKESEAPATRLTIAKPKAVITIPKSDNEKTAIIDEAMKTWITAMVGHYKDRVRAWDVVNEPMAESGQLRPGEASPSASDEFYWRLYVGETYAAKAVEYARIADPTAKLFINDYNLEVNEAKLNGLLSFVQQTDAILTAKGIAVVDGIATQTHADIRDTAAITVLKRQIDNMFAKLAATGKLIKLSELDIRVGTTTPTADLLQRQADMYRYVVESYLRNVPVAQRYGITVWGVNDRGNGSWLEDDSPCLWDDKFARKPAYKSFADGLAGEDLSAGWTYGDITNN
jgi:GH35 family endo-1,4-beta-xylanase